MTHVLVIEDDPDMQEVIALALESADYHVTRASNGQEALAEVERDMPDLILLDMRMPVMDGWTFAARFHQRYGHRVPIIVCTAAEDAPRRAREVQAAGVLSKPFELDDLLHLAATLAPPGHRPLGALPPPFS